VSDPARLRAIRKRRDGIRLGALIRVAADGGARRLRFSYPVRRILIRERGKQDAPACRPAARSSRAAGSVLG